MKTTSQHLRDVRALIDTPQKWIKGFYAADADGKPVHRQTPAACRFCLLGAVFQVTDYLDDWSEKAVIDTIRLCLDDAGHHHKLIQAFNDLSGTTHAKVMSLLDNAIARAEKEEASAH
jgi:hypothetical protein